MKEMKKIEIQKEVKITEKKKKKKKKNWENFWENVKEHNQLLWHYSESGQFDRLKNLLDLKS